MDINWSPKIIVAYVFGFTITVAVLFAVVAVEYGKTFSDAKFSLSMTEFISLPAYAAFFLLFAISIGYAVARILEFFSSKGGGE
ncbi:MAG: hypothetical protein V1731_02220 [Candidatus Aenigmatarchaeota archaeon]